MGSIGDNKEYTLIYGGMLTEEKRKHSPEKYFFLPGKTEVISISQTKDVSLYFRLFQSHEFNMIRLKKLITVTPPIKSNLLEEVAPKEKILEEEEFFNSFVKNGAGKWEIPGPLDKALLYHTVKITVLLYERDKAYPLMAIGSVIYKLVP